MSRRGAVPVAGIEEKKGPKKEEAAKRTPQTNVLRPVLAPALIPAADSGDSKTGGP